MLKVTVRYNVPIGDFRAIERRETFHALSYFKPEGSSLLYFRTDRFNIRTEAVNEIVSIEEV